MTSPKDQSASEEVWMASDGALYLFPYYELFELREPDAEDPNEPYEWLGDL